ncbi:MAG TPA: ATP-binding cassette domain-containing protein [Thermoprotei archaeon]|nr:ATP-binding cassette domain-containing protein [Thermoprotei archaeon]
MEYAVESLGLTKYYGRILAVDHIYFKVRNGEIFGFLGPNGAGKTTTIRMLTGLTRPTEGTARIFGCDILKKAIRARRFFGVVPEFSNVYDYLSAWDNLMFMGELYRVPKDERRVYGRELLELFGLYERRHEKVRTFSKGMRRRLTIAMALIHRPRLLFLDEPTSGLDVRSTIVIRNIIRRLNREGVTVFLTTHNIEEANVLCDRVAIIYRGRIVAIDSPERLKSTIESVQSIVVAFDKLSPRVLDDLRSIPVVHTVRKEGDKVRLYTSSPPDALEELFDYVRRNGLKIISINTLGPSLEDVFLKLTGGGVG